MTTGTFGRKKCKTHSLTEGKDDGTEESNIAFWFGLGMRRSMARQVEEVSWIYQIHSPGLINF